MHYYQHHIGDFIKATARLTDSQAIAYLRLLWMYYDSEKPLPNEIDVLSMQVGLPCDDVSLLLRAYFKLEDGVWKHTRCDKEIAEYRLFVEKKSNAGKASAKRRLNIRSSDVEQVLNSSPTAVQLTTNHKPITNNKEYIDRFNEFWKHYPRKIAKSNAEKAWLRIKPDDELFKKILHALKTHETFRRDVDFIPHAASWLNAKRWDDIASTQTNTSAMPSWAKTAFEAKKSGG